MIEIVGNCPRCGAAKITFEVRSFNLLRVDHGWLHWFDFFCICKHCSQSIVFVVKQTDFAVTESIKRSGPLGFGTMLNDCFNIESFRSLKDVAKVKPPEHLPSDIKSAFEEGATCMSVECFNAAATMFRLCIDHATRELLPPEADTNGPKPNVRRSLGLRLVWLFQNNKLPESLRELSTCIKEDGNDGAHAGTLKKQDAEDLIDFTTVLLERLYTEPERLKQAQARRDARRQPVAQKSAG